jgi:hypothetical protein
MFCAQAITMQFLMDVGLLQIKVQCNTCSQDMTSAEPSIPEGFRWQCVERRLLGSSVLSRGP